MTRATSTPAMSGRDDARPGPRRRGFTTPISTVVGMLRSRPVRVLSTSALVLSVTLAGCAPGLAANPRYATDSGAHPQGQPETTKPPEGPPPIEAPKNDLSWRDCTSR